MILKGLHQYTSEKDKEQSKDQGSKDAHFFYGLIPFNEIVLPAATLVCTLCRTPGDVDRSSLKTQRQKMNILIKVTIQKGNRQTKSKRHMSTSEAEVLFLTASTKVNGLYWRHQIRSHGHFLN